MGGGEGVREGVRYTEVTRFQRMFGHVRSVTCSHRQYSSRRKLMHDYHSTAAIT